MANWKLVCCAVDLTEASEYALAEAADLARRFGADLTLLHVFDVAQESLAVSEPPIVLFERALVRAREELERSRALAERVAGRPVTSVLRVGDPAHEILAFLRQRPFDLAVVGTRGRSGLERVVLGSVAERVVRQAHCPVLVFRS